MKTTMSESQAKDVIMYLAKRFIAKNNIKAKSVGLRDFILKHYKRFCILGQPEGSSYYYEFYVRKIDSGVVWRPVEISLDSKHPYLDFLNELLKTSKRGISCGFYNIENCHNVFLPAYTNLEQILIDMDLGILT